ncbi:MAG: TIGR04086 family membrane protein [Oscillospiraceae bacterium]|jgi:putative membrane protein (TIGR04086 family)|nr:TIGR04086 family membrane protein [Oscillospiraceae bacterium]
MKDIAYIPKNAIRSARERSVAVAASKARSRREQEAAAAETDFKSLLSKVGICGASGAVLLLLLCLPLGAILLKLDVSQNVLPMVVIPLAALCALAASYFSVKPTGRQGLITGLLVAAVQFVLLLLVGILALRQPIGMNAVLLLITTLVAGALGGVMGNK